MTVKLYSAKRGELQFSEHTPSDITGMLLPGANYKVASTPDHDCIFLIQEFAAEGLIIRYHHFSSRHKESFLLVDAPMTTLRIALSHSHVFHIAQMGRLVFHERNFNLLYIPHYSAEFTIGPHEQYTFVDVILPDRYLATFTAEFPLLNNFLKKVAAHLPSRLCIHHQVADIEVMRWADAFLYQEDVTIPTLVYQLICTCLQAIQQKATHYTIRSNQADIDKIYQVAELLQHSKEDCSMEELADKFNISVYKLNKLFKQIYGHSVLHHRQEEKMRLALRLIHDNRYNIKQIAYQLDYWPQNFIRAFKNRFGYTPGQPSTGSVRCIPSI